MMMMMMMIIVTLVADELKLVFNGETEMSSGDVNGLQSQLTT